MTRQSREDRDMTDTKKRDEELDEENTTENAGIEGQILYPDAEVDAERAAAYAGGKEDSLYDDQVMEGVPEGTHRDETGQLVRDEEEDDDA